MSKYLILGLFLCGLIGGCGLQESDLLVNTPQAPLPAHLDIADPTLTDLGVEESSGLSTQGHFFFHRLPRNQVLNHMEIPIPDSSGTRFRLYRRSTQNLSWHAVIRPQINLPDDRIVKDRLDTDQWVRYAIIVYNDQNRITNLYITWWFNFQYIPSIEWSVGQGGDFHDLEFALEAIPTHIETDYILRMLPGFYAMDGPDPLVINKIDRGPEVQFGYPEGSIVVDFPAPSQLKFLGVLGDPLAVQIGPLSVQTWRVEWSDLQLSTIQLEDLGLIPTAQNNPDIRINRSVIVPTPNPVSLISEAYHQLTVKNTLFYGQLVAKSPTTLLNNTFLSHDRDDTTPAILVENGSDNAEEVIIAKNNIILVDSGAIVDVRSHTGSWTGMNNLHYAEDGLGTSSFYWTSGPGAPFIDIQAFMTQTGSTASQFSDPKLDESGDFPEPRVSSPAIDGGVFLGEVGVDIRNEIRPVGDAYDIGILEGLGAPDLILPVSNLSISTASNGFTLNWTLPDIQGINSVMIRRSTHDFPQTPQDNSLVFNQLGTSFRDTDGTYGRRYYYTLFVQMESGDFSEGVSILGHLPVPSGTALDPVRPLMWQRNANSLRMRWRASQTYCANLTTGGFTDWRQPNVDELVGLYPNRGILDGFQTLTSYWTSSLGSGGVPSEGVKTVNFGRNGEVKFDHPNEDRFIRCVRNR